MKQHLLLALALCATLPALAADDEAGFVSLMDGKTFNGWKSATEHTNTWKIEDGAFVAICTTWAIKCRSKTSISKSR